MKICQFKFMAFLWSMIWRSYAVWWQEEQKKNFRTSIFSFTETRRLDGLSIQPTGRHRMIKGVEREREKEFSVFLVCTFRKNQGKLQVRRKIDATFIHTQLTATASDYSRFRMWYPLPNVQWILFVKVVRFKDFIWFYKNVAKSSKKCFNWMNESSFGAGQMISLG